MAESSKDLWCFVDDLREQARAKGRADWVDLRNLLRVVDALSAELATAKAECAIVDTWLCKDHMPTQAHYLGTCFVCNGLGMLKESEAKCAAMLEKAANQVEVAHCSSEGCSCLVDLTPEGRHVIANQVRALITSDKAAALSERITAAENEVHQFYQTGKVYTEWREAIDTMYGEKMVERERKYVDALREIAGHSDCACDCSDENCCYRVREFCHGCYAKAALRAAALPSSDEAGK